MMCSVPRGEVVVVRVEVAGVLSALGEKCSVPRVRLSWSGMVAGVLTARDNTEVFINEVFRGMRLSYWKAGRLR